MTHDKKFKALIRARMDATGESYAKARLALEGPRAELTAAADGVTGRALEGGPELAELPRWVAETLDNERRRGDEEKRRRRATWPHTATGELDPLASMTRLACLFPTLRDAPGVKPWNVESFVTWACGPAPGGGAIEAARFVLQVWNYDDDWSEFARELGLEGGSALIPFNVVRAMARWDREHQDAMLTWLNAPFYP